MISWRHGRVIEITDSWTGAVECLVDVLDDATRTWTQVRALAYPELVGAPRRGDAVLLNTTALDAGLGTGGHALIIAIPDRPPIGRPLSGGHVVKARYTPLQTTVLSVDEQDSPHHTTLRHADHLFGMPVVVADLHSSLPAVVAAAHSDAARAGRVLRIAYVMTDGAALPVWYSRTVAGLREAEAIVGCITVGQAFGGDLEAVSLHSGLLAARLVLEADITVVVPGPGVVGTGTTWGFSGVASGEAINAAAVLGGRPVAVLRVSGADSRRRHHGVSHHTLTALGRVALAPADVVIPALTGEQASLMPVLREQCAELGSPKGRHRLVEVDLSGLAQALKEAAVPLVTMGRGLEQDPAAFLSAAAAGRHAVRLLHQRHERPKR